MAASKRKKSVKSKTDKPVKAKTKSAKRKATTQAKVATQHEPSPPVKVEVPNTQAPKPVAPKPEVVLPLSHEQIAARALAVWKQRGCPQGMDEQNWHEAERQLREERTA